MFKPLGELAANVEDAAQDSGDEGDATEGVRTTTINPGEMMCLKSLCVACEDQGHTNMLLTRVPFFREVIIMAFECEHCGYRNSEVQSAEVQEKGCHFELKVATAEVSLAAPRSKFDVGCRVPRHTAAVVSRV